MVSKGEKNEVRDNLIAGRRKYKKDFIAPMIFRGSLNAKSFEKWPEIYLLPSLTMPSILIMDNAPIHRKNIIKQLIENT
ncbi:mobile element protein [Geminocystis sp. NIES-3708]|nr:mobile element protein [Geminocystis sp. NIES-3708]